MDIGEVEDRAGQVEEEEGAVEEVEEVALQGEEVEKVALQVEEEAQPDMEGPGMDFSIKGCMTRYYVSYK